jgi:hypothetical protein
MSLETKIEVLTAAVVELTRVMQTQTVLVEMPEQRPAMSAVVEMLQKKVAEEQAAQAATEEAPNESPKSSPTTDTSPPSSNESPAVTYDDVKAVTIAVSKINKAKAVAGLARFGAKNAKELQEKQWSDYVVYMKRVAAGEIDPESSHE